METKTKEEQKMLKRAKVVIAGFRSKWFPTGDDKVWKRWVDYKQREERDLVELLTSDVRDSFKRRAVFLLLVPAAEFNPIYWTKEVGKFYHRSDFLKTLTSDLLVYATDLVVEFCTMLRPMHCDKPKHYSEGGGGITVFMSVPDKYHDALCFYNNCIPLLLTFLPEEQCERIFPLFSLRDISTYCNMDDSSGYTPFQNLLRSKVDEKWKRRADIAMRKVICDELAGRTKPREDWEDALQDYSYVITIPFYGESLPYSVDLYADQIRFLVSDEHYDHELINNYDVARIFQILSADTYKETRHQIARFVVFGNKDEFRVYCNTTLSGAEMMLNEFGQDDKELAKRVQSAIDEHKKQSAKRQQKQDNAKKTEDDIMSQMK